MSVLMGFAPLHLHFFLICTSGHESNQGKNGFLREKIGKVSIFIGKKIWGGAENSGFIKLEIALFSGFKTEL